MTNINKVSSAIAAQTPQFIESDYPLFNRFLEYYYQSQEKTGLGQNILNNFLGYLDIDRLDVGIGYSWNIWNNLYIDPNFTMPLEEDEDGEREGSFNLSISYKF